jgi:hypothetical protein
MPDASNSDPEVEPQAAPVTNVSGGVNVAAQQGDVTIDGDVVRCDKIVGYTVEQVSTLLTLISSTFQPKSFDGVALIWASMPSPKTTPIASFHPWRRNIRYLSGIRRTSVAGLTHLRSGSLGFNSLSCR